MKKLIKQVACLMVAAALFLTATGCGDSQEPVNSDEILDIEYFDDGTSNGADSNGADNSGSNLLDPDNANTPSNLLIDQSSKGAKVVNNCYETGYPIAKEKVTLNIMAVDYTPGVDYNSMPFTAFVEQKFNIKLKFSKITGFPSDKVTLAYTSGNMPDMFWGIGLVDSNVLYPFEKEGRVYNLDGELSKYTPNLNKMFEERKDAKYLVTRDDGHIYSFPFVREDDNDLWWQNLYINTTWLKKLGLSMPKTTNDLRTVLRAFKNNDPNGNGKHDEIPMVFYEDVPYGWYGIFGLGTANYFTKDNNGNVSYVPTNSKYRTALSFLADLYKEGLLYNKDIASLSAVKIKSMIEGTNNVIGIVPAESYDQIMEPETFLRDYAVMSLVDGTGNGTNTWAYRDVEALWPNWGQITKACKYPEIAARLVDYFYSAEGCAVAQYGPYGTKLYWSYDENGKPKLNNNGTKNENLSPWHAIPRYYSKDVLMENFFINEPVDQNSTKQRADEVESAQMKAAYQNVKMNFIYNYRYTPEEIETLNTKVASTTNLHATHAQWRFDFIYGKKNIATEWDAYISAMDSQGAAIYEKIEQDADRRLMAAIK